MELWPSPAARYNCLHEGSARDADATLSVEFTIDVSQKVVIVTFAGEISDVDLIEIGPLTKSHPLFDPSFSEIVDFRAVTGGNVSTGTVQTLAQRTSIYNHASKHIVIAPQPHVFGLTRMFQVYAEKTRPNTVVVHTLDEAREYLCSPKKPG